MDLNEIIATVIDHNDTWHETAGRATGSLNDEIALGLNEAAAKLAAAVANNKSREEIDRCSANLLIAAILCAYRAGTADIESALTRRIEELNEANAATSTAVLTV
jgi:predicted HAD superfamily phosphohydrolase YqeG